MIRKIFRIILIVLSIAVVAFVVLFAVMFAVVVIIEEYKTNPDVMKLKFIFTGGTILFVSSVIFLIKISERI